MSQEPRYWFPAKRYGWGWGAPVTWQGWAVLAGFVALLVVGSVVIPPARHLGWFFVYQAVLCAVLVAVCYRKGEPPRWRWGGR